MVFNATIILVITKLITKTHRLERKIIMKKSIIIALIITATISLYSCNKTNTDEDTTNINNLVEYDNTDPDNKESNNPDDQIDTGNPGTEDADAEDTNSVDTDLEIVSTEEPTKLTVILEGMTEEVEASLYHSPLGYQIIYDIERFELITSEKGSDIYLVTNPEPEKYPDVYFKISSPESSNIALDDYDSKQESITTLDGAIIDFLEEVPIGTYTARHFRLIDGLEWDSIIKNFYIINSHDSDNIEYIIESQYFIEAEEGYGARIAAILDTLK